MSHSNYFSETYFDARARFKERARKAGCILVSHEHPLAKGPQGEPIFMDVAWLGARDADTVVLSLSGTHGAEGFCGSAAQSYWLSHAQLNPLPPDVAMLMVHAVNPFGFAHCVRVNENYVDLNRNGIDFSKPLPSSNEFDDFLEAKRLLIKGLISSREHDARMAALETKHGKWSVADVLGRGQYINARAPHFGGFERQWSLQMLGTVLCKFVDQARHVAYIDWHSLIESSDDEFVFLCFNQTQDHLYDRVAGWWGEQNISRETVNAQWSNDSNFATARPSRHGLVMWDVQNILAPQADVAGAVIEFCCTPSEETGILRNETVYEQNQLLVFDSMGHATSETVTAAREDLKRAYYPSRESWKSTVLAMSFDLYQTTIRGAAAWAAEDIPAKPGKLVRYGKF